MIAMATRAEVLARVVEVSQVADPVAAILAELRGAEPSLPRLEVIARRAFPRAAQDWEHAELAAAALDRIERGDAPAALTFREVRQIVLPMLRTAWRAAEECDGAFPDSEEVRARVLAVGAGRFTGDAETFRARHYLPALGSVLRTWWNAIPSTRQRALDWRGSAPVLLPADLCPWERDDSYDAHPPIGPYLTGPGGRRAWAHELVEGELRIDWRTPASALRDVLRAEWAEASDGPFPALGTWAGTYVASALVRCLGWRRARHPDVCRARSQAAEDAGRRGVDMIRRDLLAAVRAWRVAQDAGDTASVAALAARIAELDREEERAAC